MARLNEILVGRIPRFFQKFYGIKGPVPVGTVAPEIMPVHSLFHGNESRLIEGWNRYAVAVNIAAQASNTEGLQLRNPTGSNTAITVDRAFISTTTAQTVTLSMATFATDLPVPDQTLVVPLDTRIPFFSSVAQLSHSITTPANISPIHWTWVLANTPLDILIGDWQEVVIMPGGAIRLVTNTINLAAIIGFWWRERFLEEPERNVLA